MLLSSKWRSQYLITIVCIGVRVERGSQPKIKANLASEDCSSSKQVTAVFIDLKATSESQLN
jgi:hypothetical protein